MESQKQIFDDQECYNEGYSGKRAEIEVKVSADEGETWTWRTINMGGELDESGLEAGDIVQLQGEKYRVLAGDNGLRSEPVKKSGGEKKQTKRK